MTKNAWRWSTAAMTLILAISVAMNIVSLGSPSSPSANALFLWSDAATLSIARTGAVAAFLLDEEELPRGWLPLKGQRIEHRDYPQLFEAVSRNLGPAETEEGVNLPDYRGLAVMKLLGLGGEDAIGTALPWSGGGCVDHLATTLVPRAAKGSPQGSVVGLAPIVWAIKT